MAGAGWNSAAAYPPVDRSANMSRASIASSSAGTSAAGKGGVWSSSSTDARQRVMAATASVSGPSSNGSPGCGQQFRDIPSRSSMNSEASVSVRSPSVASQHSASSSTTSPTSKNGAQGSDIYDKLLQKAMNGSEGRASPALSFSSPSLNRTFNLPTTSGSGWKGAAALPPVSSAPSPMPYERSIPLSRATTPGSTANYAESSYTDGDEGDIDDISSRIASPAFSVVGRSELSRIRPAPASTPLDQEEKRTYEPVAPVNADLSGWEAGFESYEKITKQRQSGSTSPEVSRSASASGSASGKNIDDQEQFDGLYKLNSRDTPSAHPPDRVVVPPKPVKAWTFKDEFFIAPGGFVDPREIARPSQEYEQLADKFSQSYHKSNFKGKRPKLVVMDLANVLCYRNAGKAGARNARMRPYLSAFLTYLCGTEDVGGKIQRRFSVMVWSSAEPKNAKTMCEGIGLIHQGLQETTAPLIVDVWARDSMDLLPGQYDSRYATIKNLDKVWKAVEWDGGPNMRLGPVKASERSWSQADTILIDDQVHGVSSTQPFNHLPMQPWNKESAMTVKNQEPDRYLLRMIGALEELRCESNVSNALKLRPFGNVGRRWGHGGEAWEEKGRKILKSLSIKAEEFFDRDWASKMLGEYVEEDPRSTFSNQPVSTSAGVAAPRPLEPVGWY